MPTLTISTATYNAITAKKANKALTAACKPNPDETLSFDVDDHTFAVLKSIDADTEVASRKAVWKGVSASPPAKPKAPAPGTKTPVKIHEVPGRTTPVGEPAKPSKAEALFTKPEGKPRKVAAAPLSVSPGDKPLNKGDTIVALVTRPEGATKQQLMDATGWIDKSVRGFLAAGIKGKGWTVRNEVVDGVRTYYGVAIAKVEHDVQVSDTSGQQASAEEVV